MNLLEKFTAYIKQQNLFQPKDKLLLAVSGGADSIVLCELCKQAGYDFAIAHCNFQLRGEESERDENFVRGLGEKYNVEVLVKKFDTLEFAKQRSIGTQEAARGMRYIWFLNISAEKMQLNTGWHATIYPDTPKWWVATAHQLNDNIETLLMNFFKGTGIKGLRGISKTADMMLPNLIRPLLFATRKEIEQFATENSLSWVEDSSNASDKYTRNYFRNKLIPAIQLVFPEVESNLADNISRFKEVEMLYEQAVQLHKQKLIEEKRNEIYIPVLKLLKVKPLSTIVYEIFKEYNFSSHQTGEIIRLLKSESGKYIDSTTHRVLKNRNWLIISVNGSTLAQHILIEQGDKRIEFGDGLLNLKMIKTADHKLQRESNIAQIDTAEIKFPLLLRKWKQGDYFYPLGMQKKKKLSRFFIDQKLSLTQKEKVWVIESNKKILWVIGMRIDDRFKITDKTKEVLQISFSLPDS
jgi:tRNA(Ile)-lysidine synthase